MSKQAKKIVESTVTVDTPAKQAAALAVKQLAEPPLSTAVNLVGVDVAHKPAETITKSLLHAEPVRPAEREQLGRRQGGPRTAVGKQRSRQNAIQHGIFAGAPLLQGESRSQYQSLLTGLREYFQPEGFVEELLVEQLVMLVWRHRRIVAAESSTIEASRKTGREGGTSSFEDRLRAIIGEPGQSLGQSLDHRSNPHTLKRAIQSLTELRNKIASRGIDPQADSELLFKIYGHNPLAGSPRGLFKSLAVFVQIARLGDKVESISCSAEEVKDYVSGLLDSEIQHLETLRKTMNEFRDQRIDGQKEALPAPPPQALERYMRYEAHLDRLFDRILSRLERLQRTRRGQPVPPSIEVKLSA